jgi:hypothetical protein
MVNDLIESELVGLEPYSGEILTPREIDKNGVIIDMKQLVIDYELSRDNILSVINNAKSSIDSLTMLADQGQEARMYEVLGKHNQVLLEASRDLIDLTTKIKTLVTYIKQENVTETNIENNFFVGSTAELSKLVADMKKEGKFKKSDGPERIRTGRPFPNEKQ